MKRDLLRAAKEAENILLAERAVVDRKLQAVRNLIKAYEAPPEVVESSSLGG